MNEDFCVDIPFVLFESKAADIFICSWEKVEGNCSSGSSTSRWRQNTNNLLVGNTERSVDKKSFFIHLK